MVFNSSVFIFYFFPIVIGINLLIRNRKLSNYWLLLTGLGFYGWCNTRGLLFLVCYGVMNYVIAMAVTKFKHKKPVLILGLLADLGFLFLFKYFNFAVTSMNSLFGTSLNKISIFQPLGISFITFTTISYIVDVYRNKAKPLHNFFDFLLYLSFFPKIAQGPITRVEDFDSSLHTRKITFENFSEGLKRFIVGLAKKCLIADVLGKSVDIVFTDINAGINTKVAWIGILFYTFQIYFDFSGYTDMAIGIGKMLGFSLPENFNAPYLSKSVSEFWRRWHITLGAWFKEYIYFPLGGNRCSLAKNLFNLSVVWIATGIWHGAAYNFILWGIYYGILVIIERLIRNTKFYNAIPQFIKWAMTFLLVVIGWVFFRCTSISEIANYLKAMIGIVPSNINFSPFASYFDLPSIIAFAFAIVLSLPRPKIIDKLKEKSITFEFVTNTTLLFVFVLAVIFMINSSYSSFIYFQF